MAPELPTRFNYWEFFDDEQAGTEEAHYEVDLWHSPEQNADDKHWARSPFWSADEAVALAFGKDPNQVNWASVEDYVGSSRFAGYYSALRDQILQAQDDGNLPQKIRPREFFAWANDRNIDFPTSLEQAVLANETDIAELERRHQELQERCELLQRENQKLLYQLDCARSTTVVPTAATKELSEKERTSLRKLVIGLALISYPHDPHGGRNTVAKEIAAEIKKYGLHMDEDTVRKYLREGVEELPGPEPAPQPNSAKP